MNTRIARLGLVAAAAAAVVVIGVVLLYGARQRCAAESQLIAGTDATERHAGAD